MLFAAQDTLLTVTYVVCKCCGCDVSLQNEELISASKSGDVMTVVSLLNSGADVQTKDKVYIFFSHLSSP